MRARAIACTAGAATGPVRFLVDGTEVATAPLAPTGTGSSASATTTIGSLPAGSHTVRAVYPATPSFDGSSSANVAVAVAKRATTMTAEAAVVSLNTFGLPLGQLRATVRAGGQPLAGVPVEFRVGTKLVCTSTSNGSGVATCNAATQLLQLTVSGGYTATFAGDANHLSSTARGALLK